jgi:type IV pilus assembly protein PilA
MLSPMNVQDAKREEGFTLIELLVVVIIIGILAAIAIPVFLRQREKAWDAAAQSAVKNMATAQESYLTSSTSGYANGVAALETEGFTRGGTLLHGSAAYTTDANNDSYVVCAQHTNSATIWYLDSQAGVVTDTAPAAGCTPS